MPHFLPMLIGHWGFRAQTKLISVNMRSSAGKRFDHRQAKNKSALYGNLPMT